MGCAFVIGVQSGGVGTAVKHFVANEQEKNRMTVNSLVDERTLREIYLLPFEMIVHDAKPWTIMCSYNKLNGTQMGNSQVYLQEVPQGKNGGFNGLVMSDWGAVSDKNASVLNGLDLEMPGPGKRNHQVLDALEEGIISEEILNDHVNRILKVIDKIETHKRHVEALDFESHHKVAMKCAEESFGPFEKSG